MKTFDDFAENTSTERCLLAPTFIVGDVTFGVEALFIRLLFDVDLLTGVTGVTEPDLERKDIGATMPLSDSVPLDLAASAIS